MTNDTHDPSLESWVESANDPPTDFPIQNLPFGVFADRDKSEPARIGVAIGESILDLSACLRHELIGKSTAAGACERSALNTLMTVEPLSLSEFRRELSRLLRSDSELRSRAERVRDEILVPMVRAEMFLPAEIGDYTDFYASVHHATNVGRMFRPDSPLLPNYKYVPIAYHGRASSIVPTGSPVPRPRGQAKAPDAAAPVFGPSRMLDYESELGFFVGRGNPRGESVSIDDAPKRIFGFCLVNDWSARDIQAWEYQPLGPFLAKNFATTISPWIVTSEAVEPYRVPAAPRPPGDPEPMEYLRSPIDADRGGIAAILEVYLSSKRMRDEKMPAKLLSQSSFAGMYWTVAQMLTHHASNGCNLRPGDLLASGTVSGESADSRGCLLELTSRGSDPLQLPTGETRRFLEDGDEVIMRGRLEAEGRPRLGFGECRGTIIRPQP